MRIILVIKAPIIGVVVTASAAVPVVVVVAHGVPAVRALLPPKQGLPAGP